MPTGDSVRGWSDELYVTFQSSVGPNIVDILEYIIDNYTDLTYDTDSFNYVRTKLAPFPANFPLLSAEERGASAQGDLLPVAGVPLAGGQCGLLEVPARRADTVAAPVGTITVSDMDADKGMDGGIGTTDGRHRYEDECQLASDERAGL